MKANATNSELYCFGNAECDEFQVSETVFESKRPLFINLKSNQNLVKIICGSQHTLLLNEGG